VHLYCGCFMSVVVLSLSLTPSFSLYISLCLSLYISRVLSHYRLLSPSLALDLFYSVYSFGAQIIEDGRPPPAIYPSVRSIASRADHVVAVWRALHSV